MQKFYAETGIKHTDWYGKFWSRWNEAIKEAGFEPNTLVQPFSSSFLLSKLAELVNELKRFPANGDLRLKATNSKDFPSKSVFDRFGNKAMFIATFKSYCEENDLADLLKYIPAIKNKMPAENEIGKSNLDGGVYLY